MKRFIIAIAVTLLCTAGVVAQTPAVVDSAITSQKFGDEAKRQEITRKGIDYLLQKGQAEDGSFSKQLNPAITSL